MCPHNTYYSKQLSISDRVVSGDGYLGIGNHIDSTVNEYEYGYSYHPTNIGQNLYR